MDGIANHFPAKKGTKFLELAYTISKIFRGSYRMHPGGWTQTPISAWLGSVTIVPVLRNDKWWNERQT